MGRHIADGPTPGNACLGDQDDAARRFREPGAAVRQRRRARIRRYRSHAPFRRPLPVAPADCQIAAIARARGMAVATRNVRDVEDMGIEVVDPWADA